MFWNLKPFEYSVCTAKNAGRGRGDSVGSVVAGTVDYAPPVTSYDRETTARGLGAGYILWGPLGGHSG